LRARLLRELERYQEAFQGINEAVNIFPFYDQVYFERGRIYDEYGQTQEALADYRRAAELNPGDAQYHWWIGTASMFLGQRTQAIEAYEQYVAMMGAINVDEDTLTTLAILRDEEARGVQSEIRPLNLAPLQDHYDTAGQILYWHKKDGDDLLFAAFVIDAQGNHTQITQYTEMYETAWSPDGQRIAFSTLTDLYLATPDGANITELAAILDMRAPTNILFSPDSQWLAYTLYDEIWVVSADGRQKINLAATYPGYVFEANLGYGWMPDGPHLLVSASARAMPDSAPVLYQVQVDGTADIDLWMNAVEGSGGIANPQFSPDGQWLAFRPSIGERSEVWVVDAAQNLRAKFQLPNYVSDMIWSPDSSQIAFAVFEAQDRDWDIYVAGLQSGAAPLSLTDDLPGLQYLGNWTPDSQYVIFTSDWPDENGPSEIFRRRYDGSDLMQITQDGLLKRDVMISPIVE
jgi:Tol biopolymer transport system component